MKVLIETNVGMFAGFFTETGEIVLYQGACDVAIATLPAFSKQPRGQNFPKERVSTAIRSWLESHDERMEIESITIHPCALGAENSGQGVREIYLTSSPKEKNELVAQSVVSENSANDPN